MNPGFLSAVATAITFAERMTAIEKIENKLRKYPSALYSRVGDTIKVEATDGAGFSVWLRRSQDTPSDMMAGMMSLMKKKMLSMRLPLV